MEKTILLSEEKIMDRIYVIRGKKVMLDRDLAELYGVVTGNLNQAVKRNHRRFPDDFMFQLTDGEFKNLISQSVISKDPSKDSNLIFQSGIPSFWRKGKAGRNPKIALRLYRTRNCNVVKYFEQ
jgi:hypothetical protein